MAEAESEASSRERHHSRSGSSKNSSSLSSQVSLPAPPDGGWGWVVVFASFMVHLIADGCGFSFGVLYVELLSFFGESKGKTAWVGSLFVSVPLITGPIASALTNRYGCRVITMAGGLIAGIGFVISAFANSIEVLCFTFGIVAGFGLSLVYVPAVIIVAYYFEKQRSFATGIAVAGSGIGTFVFAPMTEYLIQEYTWRGAVVIIGGIMLNIMVCGAVFRPLMSTAEKEKKKAIRRAARASMPGSTRTSTSGPTVDGKLLVLLEDLDVPVAHSLVQFPTYLEQDVAKISPDLLKDIREKKTLHQILEERDLLDQYHATQSLTDVPTGTNNATSPPPTTANGHLDERELIWCKQPRPPRFPHHRLPPRQWPMYRKDIFYRGSLLRGQRSSSCPHLDMQGSSSSSEDLSDRLWVFRLLRFSREVKHVIKEMLDMAILRSVVFVYFCISSMMLYMWYDVPYVYTPDKAIGMNISEEHASFLISIIGIVSTFGQIIIGYIGDRPSVDSLHLYNALTTIAGVSVIIVPHLNTYEGLATASGMFGFFISANYALTTIILVDLLGMEKLTNAYGLVMLAEGTANLVGPPIAGETTFTHFVLSYLCLLVIKLHICKVLVLGFS